MNLERYRELVEITSEITLVLDDSDTIDFVNGVVTDVLGFERRELIGEDLSSLITRESNGDLAAAIAEIRAGENRSNRIKTRFRAADGSPRSVDILVDPIGGDDSNGIVPSTNGRWRDLLGDGVHAVRRRVR